MQCVRARSAGRRLGSATGQAPSPQQQRSWRDGQFDAKSLTAETAKAIHEAFRQTGLRGGPALADTLKAAGCDFDKLRDLAPPPGEGQRGNERVSAGERDRDTAGDRRPPPRDRESGGQGQYSIEQAISDGAQLNTIAFDGLAFLTGDPGGNTFLPPGKVADFSGFQYLRDNDPTRMGHNTDLPAAGRSKPGLPRLCVPVAPALGRRTNQLTLTPT